MKLPITSITPFTFQDYPDHTACILWFSGCNMACGYCHNPELVKGLLPKLPFEKVQSFLESRVGLLDGVVLSGGECTLSPALPELVLYLKRLKFKVKLDTNGTAPSMLKRLVQEGLVDYVALDFKAPPAKFEDVTGAAAHETFQESLEWLCGAGIPLEIRTTLHPSLLDEDDVHAMMEVLEASGFQGTYFIQKYRHGNTLGDMAPPLSTFDTAKLRPASFGVQFHNF